MFNMMAGVNEKLERHDGILNQLQGEPRQRRHPPIDQEDYEGEDDLDDDQVTLVGQQINPRRQARRGRPNDDVDRNLGSIKMKIPSFQGICTLNERGKWNSSSNVTIIQRRKR